MDQESKVFNFAQLEEVTAGDPDFTRELLEEFTADIPNSLDRLKDALNQGDCDGVLLEAHSIKGSSMSLGAQALGDSAGLLENKAAQGDLEGWETMFAQILKQFDRTREAIRGHFKKAA